MKIAFYSRTNNLNTGSYRIWVYDLCRTLNDLNNNSSKIFYDKIELQKEVNDGNFDIVIFCKSSYFKIDEIVSGFKNKPKIGAINIDKNFESKNIDFVIVGSIEEYTSMSKYKNVFIYPLIERKFENVKRKIHTEDSEKLNLVFHGHYPHLFKFEPHLKNAINYIHNNVKKIHLHVITGNPKFEWKIGRPDVDITFYEYNKNFTDIVKSCDIGIVPNVSDIRLSVPDIEKVTSVDLGLYNTDFFFRMKNKTNSGRAYVFYQHGIPVIHDLSPSNFDMMSNTKEIICAHDALSWVREINKLSNFKTRDKISKKYYNVFKELYDPHKHAVSLKEKIEEV